MSSLQSGDQLDHYRIENLVAEGGMASVYRADLRTGRPSRHQNSAFRGGERSNFPRGSVVAPALQGAARLLTFRVDPNRSHVSWLNLSDLRLLSYRLELLSSNGLGHIQAIFDVKSHRL